MTGVTFETGYDNFFAPKPFLRDVTSLEGVVVMHSHSVNMTWPFLKLELVLR